MKKVYDAIVTPDYIVVRIYGVFAHLTRLGRIYQFETGHLTRGLAVVVNCFSKKCFAIQCKEWLNACILSRSFTDAFFDFLLHLGEYHGEEMRSTSGP